MHTYTRSIEINKSIEEVFNFLDGSEKNVKIIDPNIASSKLVKQTENVIGSTYEQEYNIKNQTINYIATVTEYKNEANIKEFGVSFKLKNMFEISTKYRLTKIDENTTAIEYTIVYKPIKMTAKLTLKLASTTFGDNLVKRHLENVNKHFS